jgi:ABC-type phosphate transport system substrate-binding protein
MFKRMLSLLAVLSLAAAPARPRACKIVVHSGNAVSSMTRDEVARLFLKKVTSWPDGQPTAPVDLSKGSAVRQAFSQGVLGKAVSSVESYWQQAIFSGRAVPPPERSSDAEVLTFVREHSNAIGYVSGDADLGSSVKELTVN